METFSLLKYWRASGTATSANIRTAASANVRTTTKTIATSVLRSSTTSEPSSSSEEGDDEGSFFDLELSADNQNEEETVVENYDLRSEESEDEEEENSSDDNLFFKGQLLPLDVEESSSIVIASSDNNNKPGPHFSVSLLKSATKFRVFMLGFKKPKPSRSTSDHDPNAAAAGVAGSPNHNRFFIKFIVEEVPFVSLFARESRSKKNPKTQKVVQTREEGETKFNNASSKETVQKYINKIKPLYVRVSKRYVEKLRFSGLLTAEDEAAVRLPPAGTRIARKRLGKSKSAVVLVASTPAVSQRRDDSLQQQQDGIQSAIAHCKMTLNAAKGLHSPLVRSKSDPSDDRSENVNVVL